MSQQDAIDALEMIQEAKADGHAATLTFTRVVRESGQYDPETGTYNPATGEYEPPEPDPEDENDSALTFTGIAVVLPASQGTAQAFDVRFESGTLIESRLRALLIAAHGMTNEPKPGDAVTFPDGTGGILIGCTPLNPDVANPIIYQGTVKI